MARERIFIVDDNAANVKLVEFLLSSRGYQVRTAADAAQALSTLGDFSPQLILMDLQLPGMDGFELMRLLRAGTKARDVRIVAVTAYTSKDAERRARSAGCDEYVAKPIDTQRLPRLVADCLARQRNGAPAQGR